MYNIKAINIPVIHVELIIQKPGFLLRQIHSILQFRDSSLILGKLELSRLAWAELVDKLEASRKKIIKSYIYYESIENHTLQLSSHSTKEYKWFVKKNKSKPSAVNA